MNIRPLAQRDRVWLHSMLTSTLVFTSEEIDVAMELIDVVLKDPNEKDYEIYCMVDDEDQPIGYICYGPTPMTQGTFDLYWIASTQISSSGDWLQTFRIFGGGDQGEERATDSC